MTILKDKVNQKPLCNEGKDSKNTVGNCIYLCRRFKTCLLSEENGFIYLTYLPLVCNKKNLNYSGHPGSE